MMDTIQLFQASIVQLILMLGFFTTGKKTKEGNILWLIFGLTAMISLMIGSRGHIGDNYKLLSGTGVLCFFLGLTGRIDIRGIFFSGMGSILGSFLGILSGNYYAGVAGFGLGGALGSVFRADHFRGGFQITLRHVLGIGLGGVLGSLLGFGLERASRGLFELGSAPPFNRLMEQAPLGGKYLGIAASLIFCIFWWYKNRGENNFINALACLLLFPLCVCFVWLSLFLIFLIGILFSGFLKGFLSLPDGVSGYIFGSFIGSYLGGVWAGFKQRKFSSANGFAGPKGWGGFGGGTSGGGGSGGIW